MASTEEKLCRLRELLSLLDSAVVAFSGGVDSTFLLKMCRDVMGGKVLAVTADSPTYSSDELDNAVKIAKSLQVELVVIETKEFEDPRFVANPFDRCYYCKMDLFRSLREIAAAHGISSIVDGSNSDDLEDYRPGIRAAAEIGVRHPLQEVGLTKAEIRVISREMGLLTWNKPSQACLASRIPYGTPITGEALTLIDSAETFIRSLGIEQVRVRHYGKTARIEVEPRNIELLACETNRQRTVSHFKELGYVHVTLDLAGYRSGSMNEDLPREL